MDLHPIFVHFPIALLAFYSFFEVVKRFTKNDHWFSIRAVLVISGVVMAFMALSTGEVAEHLYKGTAQMRTVLEVHSFVASATTWIYAIVAAAYLIAWLELHTSLLGSPPKPIVKPVAIARAITEKILGTWIAPILAILGFIALSLTGALGAMLVYGPEFDPLTALVYKLLF